MKKFLLATTLLSATAGFAAAEVTLSGDARMGIIDNGGASDVEFTSRARVAFALSGETDGGLSFGASFRADNAGDAAKGTAGSVFISGAFGKVSFGDVDSAFKATFGDIAGVGLTGLGDKNELGHSADGGKFGAVPSVFTTGGVGRINYNSLFTPNAAGAYLTSPAAITAAGANIEQVWGSLFDQAQYNSIVATLPTFSTSTTTYTNTVVSFPVAQTGVLNGFEAAIIDAAKAAKIENATQAATPGVLLNFDGFNPLPNNVYLSDDPLKADKIAANKAAGLDYLSFDISMAGVKPIDAKVLYEYTMGDFAVAAGYSQTGKNEAYSLSGAYSINGFKLSAGIAKAQWDDAIVASITGFGNIVQGTLPSDFSNADGTPKTASFTISNASDLEADDVNFGLSYTMDAITLAAVHQRKEFSINNMEVDQLDTTGVSVAYKTGAFGVSAFGSTTDSSASGKTDTYGLGASYDLGGGASVVGGVVGGDADTTYDLGVSMTF